MTLTPKALFDTDTSDTSLEPLYLGGRLVSGRGAETVVINPGTGEPGLKLRWADAAQALEALEAAQVAFPGWARLPLDERGRWLNRLADAVEARADELMDLVMAETGKSLAGAKYDLEMLTQCLRYFPEEARRKQGVVQPDWGGRFRHLIVHQPVGVVLAYVAWNFPLLNLGYKLGPALAAGCTIVVKPSELTPASTLRIGRIAHEIGLPPGVFNVVVGPASELGPVMSGSTIPRMISMIGSSEAGRRVIRDSSTSVKRFSLELGGNAPALVLPDADLADAARQLVDLKFTNAGQVCVSPNRVFVHRSVLEPFLEAARARAEGLRLGWGRDACADVGPLISDAARKRVSALVEEAVTGGARVVCGGQVPPERQAGFYLEPTILADVTPEMRAGREEIFGPVMPVIAFDTVEEAVRLANDTPHGLAAYLFTNDARLVFSVSEALEAGTVCVNEPVYAVYLPHGGIKESGVGKDCSPLSLDDYYVTKRISIRS